MRVWSADVLVCYRALGTPENHVNSIHIDLVGNINMFAYVSCCKSHSHQFLASLAIFIFRDLAVPLLLVALHLLVPLLLVRRRHVPRLLRLLFSSNLMSPPLSNRLAEACCPVSAVRLPKVSHS